MRAKVVIFFIREMKFANQRVNALVAQCAADNLALEYQILPNQAIRSFPRVERGRAKVITQRVCLWDFFQTPQVQCIYTIPVEDKDILQQILRYITNYIYTICLVTF